jgi:hypothetical protein
MIFGRKIVGLLFIFTASVPSGRGWAQGSWQEVLRELQYSPRYFGPNAFPLPELRSGRLESRWEVELRGEDHACEGDRTRDLYARVFVPVAEGRAGVEVGGVVYEYYNMTDETVKERHAAGRSWKAGAHGDILVSAFYQLLRSDKWVDLMLDATLKTASGDRLADARYTDAATYWFDLNAGRCLYKNPNRPSSFLRIQALAGFYCWMTNDIVHRQNDAFLFSAGISGAHENCSFEADLAGFHGYKNNGDRPLQLRTKFNYEYRKNILSLRYKHGLKDCLYDSLSLAYIRCF